MYKVVLIFITFLFSAVLFAQDTLTLESAISIALEKNYQIMIMRNTTDIASMNNAAGNAGMLPTVRGQVTDNFSQNNIFQRFSTGNEISANNALGNNLGAAVILDWTLFDGFRMFATREKLRALDEQGQISLRQKMALTVEEVSRAYGQLVNLQQQLDNINEIISFNEEREKIALARFYAGIASKTDWLQAKIDLNNQRQQKMKLETDIIVAGNALDVLLAFPEGSTYHVSRYKQDDLINVDEMEQSITGNNYEILLADKNRRIAELTIKEAESVRLPKLTFSGAYNFSNVNSTAGFSLLNRSFGPSAGLVLSIPLFNGGNINRTIQTSRIQAESANLVISAVAQQVRTEFRGLRENYRHLAEMSELEQESALLAKENLEISTERFRQGQTTSLEISQAQVTYQNSLTRLAQYGYDLSTTKVRLLLLAGKL